MMGFRMAKSSASASSAVPGVRNTAWLSLRYVCALNPSCACVMRVLSASWGSAVKPQNCLFCNSVPFAPCPPNTPSFRLCLFLPVLFSPLFAHSLSLCSAAPSPPRFCPPPSLDTQDKDMIDQGRWPAPGAVSSNAFDASAINRKVVLTSEFPPVCLSVSFSQKDAERRFFGARACALELNVGAHEKWRRLSSNCVRALLQA